MALLSAIRVDPLDVTRDENATMWRWFHWFSDDSKIPVDLRDSILRVQCVSSQCVLVKFFILERDCSRRSSPLRKRESTSFNQLRITRRTLSSPVDTNRELSMFYFAISLFEREEDEFFTVQRKLETTKWFSSQRGRRVWPFKELIFNKYKKSEEADSLPFEYTITDAQ